MGGALATTRDVRSPVWIRALNVLLGAWLFASAFVWQHQGNVAFNNLVCGLVVAASALCAIWAPPFRWVNVGIAAWLVYCAAFFDYGSELTRLHDLALAGAIFVVAMARPHTGPVSELQVST
jgi:hypothetical protein